MPDNVIDIFGFALHLSRAGKKHDQAKQLKDFGGAGLPGVLATRINARNQAEYTINR